MKKRSEIIRRKKQETLNEALLREGLVNGVLKDLIQFLVGCAAEYGITIATGGTGVVAAEATETFIDGVFAIQSITSSSQAIKEISNGSQEYKELLHTAIKQSKLLSTDLDEFYTTVDNIVSKFIKSAKNLSKEGTDKVIEKLKDLMNKLISKLSDSAVEGIKVLIPDAVVGGIVSTAIRTAISSAGEKPFDAGKLALESSKNFKGFILERGVASKFFESLGHSLVALLNKAAENAEDSSWIKTIVSGGIVGGVAGASVAAIIKKLGPDGLRSVANKIQELIPKLTSLIDTIVSTIIPALFACFAIMQSVQDYEKANISDEEKKTESILRNFVRLQLLESLNF